MACLAGHLCVHPTFPFGHIPGYTVETHGMASLNASLNAGKLVRLDKVRGIATTLAARRVCEHAFNVASRLNARSWLVSDQEALNACRRIGLPRPQHLL